MALRSIPIEFLLFLDDTMQPKRIANIASAAIMLNVMHNVDTTATATVSALSVESITFYISIT